MKRGKGNGITVVPPGDRKKTQPMSKEQRDVGEVKRRIDDVREGLRLEREVLLEVWEVSR